MSARALPALALFLALWPGSARAIDCSAPASDYAAMVCADKDLILLDRKIDLAVLVAGEAMEEAERQLLSENQQDWREDVPYCRFRTPRDCKAEMTARLLFLNGEPETGPGTDQRLMLTAYRSKPIETSGRKAQVVPRFGAAGSAAERLYNAKVDEIIERDRHQPADEPVYMLWRLRLIFASPRLMSTEHDYMFPQTEDSGDPWSGIDNINIDVRRGALLDIAKVFPEESLRQLEETCIRQMAAKLAKRRLTLADMGVVQVSPEDYDRLRISVPQRIRQQEGWTFRPRESVVTFNDGSIDYSGLGPEVCRIPGAELRQLAYPDAPLP